MDTTAAATKHNVVSRACNVEDIFGDFEARRGGLLKAFGDDVIEFHMQCRLRSPYKGDLRLYGLPDRSWELKVAEEDHCELENIPPPTIGIKLARPNNMQDNPWIPLIALHGDSWLLAVAFYYASKSGFDEADRERLYGMIKNVPTLSESVRWRIPENKEVSSEGTTEDEEDCFDEDEEDGLNEDEADEEDDEVDGDENDEECFCEGCHRKFMFSGHWKF